MESGGDCRSGWTSLIQQEPTIRIITVVSELYLYEFVCMYDLLRLSMYSVELTFCFAIPLVSLSFFSSPSEGSCGLDFVDRQQDYHSTVVVAVV